MKGCEYMIFAEELCDVFERGKGCYLVHCISSDYALEADSSAKFREMGVVELLREKYPEVQKKYEPCCLETSAGSDSDNYKGVFHLVTRERCEQKPTYESLKDALMDMREQIKCKYEHGEKITVVMPLIDCGIDMLDWDVVREVITDVFLEASLVLIACHPDTQKI